jgi:hypothetical protein
MSERPSKQSRNNSKLSRLAKPHQKKRKIKTTADDFSSLFGEV